MKLKEFISEKPYLNYHLLLIVFLGAVLRFYNLPKRYGFDFDAARDSLVASFFSEKLSFPLTGAASSTAPFNFGPWYYWGLIIFEKIIPIYGSWILIGVVSLLTVIVAYKIGEKMENKNFGLILAWIFALSPSQITLSTTLSNPSMIPFFSGLVILFFISYINTKKSFYVFLMSLFLSMGITIHFQLAGFIIFPILIFLFYRNRIKNILSMALGIIVPLIPILIFELSNNFYNFKGLVFYFTESRENVYVANRWLFYVRDFWPKFWSETLGLNLSITVIILSSLFVLFLYLFKKRKINKIHLMIVAAFVFNFILLRYFPAQKPIYYLYFLQIFIFIFSGFLLFKLIEIIRIKPIGLLVIVILLIVVLIKDIDISTSESSNREVISIQKELIEKNPNNKFNILVCDSDLSEGMGLIYLLNKKNLLSEEGNEIFIKSNCDKNKAILDSSSISLNDLKNMQVFKSY